MGGVFAKNTSVETKFHPPVGSGNSSALDWYFSQIPLPNMIYLYIIRVRTKWSVRSRHRSRGWCFFRVWWSPKHSYPLPWTVHFCYWMLWVSSPKAIFGFRIYNWMASDHTQLGQFRSLWVLFFSLERQSYVWAGIISSINTGCYVWVWLAWFIITCLQEWVAIISYGNLINTVCSIKWSDYLSRQWHKII